MTTLCLLSIILVASIQVAETVDDKWLPAVTACIAGANTLRFAGKTIEECMELCENETSFTCLSIEYYMGATRDFCTVSSESKDTVDISKYKQPCYDSLTEIIYIQRSDNSVQSECASW